MAPRVWEHLAWLGPREDDVHDGKDSDQVVTPAEGVRILGAEEAHAALAADRDRDDQNDRDGGTQPSLDLSDAERADRRREAGFADAGPSWRAARSTKRRHSRKPSQNGAAVPAAEPPGVPVCARDAPGRNRARSRRPVLPRRAIFRPRS